MYESDLQITCEMLHLTLKAHDLDLPEESIDEIAGMFHDLDVFDNVADRCLPSTRRVMTCTSCRTANPIF